MKKLFDCLKRYNENKIYKKQIKNWESKNNQFILIKDGKEIPFPKINGLNIEFLKNAKNAKIILHYPIKTIDNLKIVAGFNSYIEIFESEYYYKNTSIVAAAENAKIRIGKNTSMNTGCNLCIDYEPDLSIEIGEECMFAPDVIMRPSDGHSVLSKSDNSLLNKGKSIKIGNRVWFSQKVFVTKGAEIPDNTIVGVNSYVNKKYTTENTMIAGAPAKVVKENIVWSRKRPNEFY